MVGKRWANSDLESNTPFGVPQNLELVNFLLLTSLWLVFYWHLHLIASCRQFPEKDTSCPLTFVCRVRSRNISVSDYSVHAHKTLDLQFSLVILNYNECLCLVIQWLLSALFIYQFIQFPMSCLIMLHK